MSTRGRGAGTERRTDWKKDVNELKAFHEFEGFKWVSRADAAAPLGVQAPPREIPER